MNEISAIITFLLLGTLILLTSKFGKIYLYVLSSFFIITSNITVGIQVDVFGLSISWAVIIYSMVYLATDVLSEFHEKNAAYKLALNNIMVQVLFWIYILISLQVTPSGGESAYKMMEGLFSTTPRITIAALVASLGAFFDIFIYERIKSFFANKKNIFAQLWLRNNISTILGQSLNTILFFLIALYGVIPNIWEVIIGALIVKAIVASLDTPFMYVAKWIYRK